MRQATAGLSAAEYAMLDTLATDMAHAAAPDIRRRAQMVRRVIACERRRDAMLEPRSSLCIRCADRLLVVSDTIRECATDRAGVYGDQRLERLAQLGRAVRALVLNRARTRRRRGAA